MALLYAQCIKKQVSPTKLNLAESSISLKGTDIYNGLRGQSFNESWKINEWDVNNGQDISYDDSGWENISLPHDWSIFNPIYRDSPAGSHRDYMDGGVGWYRKTFTVPADYKNKKVFINFDGAYPASLELAQRPNHRSMDLYKL